MPLNIYLEHVHVDRRRSGLFSLINEGNHSFGGLDSEIKLVPPHADGTSECHHKVTVQRLK